MDKTEPSKEITTVSPAANYLGLGFTDIKNVATALFASGIFKDVRDANVAFAKILAGQEMGLTPFAAMQEISFINGKPSLSANAKAAKVKQSGKYDYKIVELDGTHCVLEFSQNGKSQGKVEYTEDMAKLGGEYNRNPNYKTHPDDMYFAGAMRKGQKRFAPDATGGISTYDREEWVDGEIIEPVPEPMPPGMDVVAEALADIDKALTPITPAQRNKIFAILGTDKGIKDKEAQKRIIQAMVKSEFDLEIESTNELTKEQANDLIEKLTLQDPDMLTTFFVETETF